MPISRRLARPAIAVAVAAVALAGVTIPAGAAPGSRPAARPTGNFVSNCRYSHTAPDDPIVHPANPGGSHSHDFFGNTSTDAFSSLESLQAAPELCRRDGDSAAYWVPTLSDAGRVVKPTNVAAYYLVFGRDPTSIQPFPLGLRVVTDPAGSPERWACAGGDRQTPETTTVPDCPAGMHLVMRIHFPDCWDGTRIDSSDHRSHMAYAARGACPSTHPVAVPHLRLDTGHADFFNAWDPAAQARLVDQCLHAAIECGGTGPA